VAARKASVRSGGASHYDGLKAREGRGDSVASGSTSIHLLNGEEVTVSVSVEQVLDALSAPPGPHGLLKLKPSTGNALYIRGDQIAYVAAAPDGDVKL
jgi:hypothetical protein